MLLRLILATIRLYQRFLSPLLGNICRFEPSCSRYAVACLEAHGPVRGGLLSVKRLCKCHPFHPGGVDPPPVGLPRTGRSGESPSMMSSSSQARPLKVRSEVANG